MRGTRVLLVDGFDDPLVRRVAADLGSALAAAGGELALVTEAERGGEGFVALSRLDVPQAPAGWPAPPDPEAIALEERARKACGASLRRVQEDLRRWAWEADWLCEAARPDLVVAWNGLLPPRRLHVAAARRRGLSVAFAEKGVWPGTFSLDPSGVGPLSRFAGARGPVSPEEVQAFAGRLAEMEATGASAWGQPGRRPPEELRRRLGARPGERVLLFVDQVRSDTNLLLFSPAFATTEEAQLWCARGLPEGWRLAVKPHPREPGPARVVPGAAALAGVNVLDAIALADCVAGINSGVLLEAAVRGKPVLVLGRSVLSGRAFVTEPRAGEAVAGALGRCLAAGERRQEALAFGAWLDAESVPLGSPERARRALESVAGPARTAGEARPSLGEVAARLRRRPLARRLTRLLRRTLAPRTRLTRGLARWAR